MKTDRNQGCGAEGWGFCPATTDVSTRSSWRCSKGWAAVAGTGEEQGQGDSQQIQKLMRAANREWQEMCLLKSFFVLLYVFQISNVSINKIK